MIPINSKLESCEQSFADVQQVLDTHFLLGGNWDYDHGSFDCALDEENKVWLRLPFTVVTGTLEGDTIAEQDHLTTIRFGQPFVLKHVYNEGLDPEAAMRTAGAMLDQFQPPLDPDAEIEHHWVEKASEMLTAVEQRLPQ